MKKLSLLLTIFIIISCTDDETPETLETLTGSWKLTEVLLDPGDGSGEFQSVESDNTLNFSTDGETVTSNYSFCNPNLNEQTSAIYSEAAGTITLENGCGDTPFLIYFEMQDSTLILNYPCIEPCRYKYVKR
ncbi:hypothetical protein EZY14_014550 [Kordia sp. TARA_039_SRF]|nr:hypothetical protein EZY14_014550 [Kordia sp. TARA_039_SRF]